MLSSALLSIFDIEPLLVNANIPVDNVFGVFTTLRKKEKDKKYPYGIRGCLGYWSNDYKSLSESFLKEKIKQLSRETAYEDDRKDYFDEMLEKDCEIELEISYMLLPIQKLNDSFNNKYYGIIFDDHHNRATYLPGVFENITLEEIKKSVTEKSGGKKSKIGKFYMYKTKTISNSMYNILFSADNINTLENKYINFHKSHKHLPYEILDDKVIENKKEDVRNMAVLATLIKIDYDSFIEKYKKYEPYIKKRQAYTSLDMTDDIADYLFSQLYLMDFEFELPQTCISLSNSKYKEKIKKIVIDSTKKLNLIKIDDVFSANWWIQANLAYNITKNYEIFEKYYISIIDELENAETNYLAVYFEGVSFLLKKTKNEKLKCPQFYSFILLLKRYDTENGLFKFLDGNSRIDITNHVMCGLLLEY